MKISDEKLLSLHAHLGYAPIAKGMRDYADRMRVAQSQSPISHMVHYANKGFISMSPIAFARKVAGREGEVYNTKLGKEIIPLLKQSNHTLSEPIIKLVEEQQQVINDLIYMVKQYEDLYEEKMKEIEHQKNVLQKERAQVQKDLSKAAQRSFISKRR